MKLVITESQYKMLKIVNESIKDVEPYIEDIKKIGEEVNCLYNLVLTINVGDVIDGTSDYKKYKEKAELLENKLYNRYKLGSAEIEKIPEEEYIRIYSDMPVSIDKILYDEYKTMDRKLGKIQDIISALQKIEETTE